MGVTMVAIKTQTSLYGCLLCQLWLLLKLKLVCMVAYWVYYVSFYNLN